MDILVTGAGGRIGSALCRMLHREGHRVRGLGVPDDPGLAAISDELDVEVFVGDITDPGSLNDAVEGVDAVCHLAAALTTHSVPDEAFVQANFVGTFNLLTTVRSLAPKISRFVYTSSDAVYWPGGTGEAHYLPVDESHPLVAGSVYGATKVGAEALCSAFWKSDGIPYAVMRPTATARPGELIDPASPFGRRWFLSSAISWLEAIPDPSPADSRLLGKLKPLHTGEERLFYLVNDQGESSLTMLAHPRDVAAGMRSMIDRPEAVGEAFNIGPAEPHTEADLVRYLGDALDLEVVEVQHDALRPSWYVSSAKATAALGYTPTTSVYDLVDLATRPS